MKAIKRKQYFIAAALGLGTLLIQLFVMFKAVGLDLAHDRARLMQQQLLQRLWDDPSALATVIAYLGAAVFAHLTLTILALAAFRISAKRFFPRWLNRLIPSTLFILLTLLVASFWNRLLFPMSRVFESGELLMIQAASPVLVWGGSVAVLSCVLIATCIQASTYPKTSTALLVALGAFGFSTGTHHNVRRTENGAPDIVILGIDSLRPDFLPAYGFASQTLTPNINRAMQEMVVFEDALTPLARTFVSYMSLLKGENPVRHGARFNLYPRTEFSTKDTLAWRFHDRDYHTILATDESRFANFDETFGFDEVIVPSVGALDFVVGSNYDFLATNLLLKTESPRVS